MENQMNIYKIWQELDCGYGKFDSAVVAAENEDDAKSIHPDGSDEIVPSDLGLDPYGHEKYTDWAVLRDIRVKFLGVADISIPRGVIVSSNTGG